MTTEFIKYPSLYRFGKREATHMLENAKHITISEKIDGSNASVRLIDGEIKVYSRNKELSETETLRGFYGWVKSHFDVNTYKELVGSDYILFGEWLVKHTISYDDSSYGKFYLFDVYEISTNRFLNSNMLAITAEILNLEVAPIFYTGEFISVDHIQSFVGKSELGEYGEGVVVKNDEYQYSTGENVYVKFISDKFAETNKIKKDKVLKTDSLDSFVESVLTPNRVEKLLHKLVDEGELHTDYSVTDMGIILKTIGGKLFEDVVNEELDVLMKELKGKIGRKTPLIVKEVLKQEGRM